MNNRKAFTLVEMLLVITVIGILAGLLLPMVGRSIQKAKKGSASATAQNIAHAVRSYYTEYGRLPLPNSAVNCGGLPCPDENAYPNGGTCDAAASREICLILYGNDTPLGMNPRKIAFLGGIVHADGRYLDPWGNQYLMKFDSNYDQDVVWYNTPPGSYRASVVVVSTGRNGIVEDPATGDDVVAAQ